MIGSEKRRLQCTVCSSSDTLDCFEKSAPKAAVRYLNTQRWSDNSENTHKSNTKLWKGCLNVVQS